MNYLLILIDNDLGLATENLTPVTLTKISPHTRPIAQRNIFINLVKQYDSALIQTFLDNHPAAIHETDEFGQNALLLTAAQGDLNLVTLLYERGTTPDSQTQSSDPSIHTMNALDWAVYRNHHAVADFLKTHELTANLPERTMRIKRFNRAARYNHPNVIQDLLSTDEPAPNLINEPDKGFTPLQWAIMQGNFDVIALLNSADIYQTSEYKNNGVAYTALDLALQYSQSLESQHTCNCLVQLDETAVIPAIIDTGTIYIQRQQENSPDIHLYWRVDKKKFHLIVNEAYFPNDFFKQLYPVGKASTDKKLCEKILSLCQNHYYDNQQTKYFTLIQQLVDKGVTMNHTAPTKLFSRSAHKCLKIPQHLRLLLQLNPALLHTQYHGMNLLHYAIIKQLPGVTDLIYQGIDIHALTANSIPDLKAQDFTRMTALDLAYYFRRDSAIQNLKHMQAATTLTDNDLHVLFFLRAIKENNCSALINLSPKYFHLLNHPFRGDCLLDIAMGCSDESLVCSLINKGAQSLQKPSTFKGKDIFSWLTEKQLNPVKILLHCNSDLIHSRNAFGFNLLHQAVYCDFFNGVKLLIEKGIRDVPTTNENLYALELAMSYNHKDIALYLAGRYTFSNPTLLFYQPETLLNLFLTAENDRGAYLTLLVQRQKISFSPLAETAFTTDHQNLYQYYNAAIIELIHYRNNISHSLPAEIINELQCTRLEKSPYESYRQLLKVMAIFWQPLSYPGNTHSQALASCIASPAPSRLSSNPPGTLPVVHNAL